MSKYLKNGMRLVYLDQCVLSRFLERPQNERWRDLRSLILKGHANRRILCPRSLEHLVETAALSDNDAIFLDELMADLSFDWTLIQEPLLIAAQIVSKLRKRPMTRSQFLAKGLLRPMKYPGTLEQLRLMKVGMDSYNSSSLAGFNEFNALIRGGRRPTKEILDYFIKRRTVNCVKKLRLEVENALRVGHVVLRAEEHNSAILNWASKVVYEIITKHRLLPVEGEKLCTLLQTEKLDFIPTLKIKAELEAMQFFRQENITPGDQYDITRAACALPYADVFITDGGKASAIKELNLDTTYQTEVFSLKETDSAKLLQTLTQITA